MILRPIVTATVLVVIVALVVPFHLAEAKVTASVNGISNGTVLVGSKGPSGINQRMTVQKSGGSIRRAWARALFRKYDVAIGNEVIAKKTSGDHQATHVRAGSLFFGLAKFVAAKKGQTVRNFKIKYHVDGDLRCEATGKDIPADYSQAMVETQVRFNALNRFAGTGTVDGVTGFDGGTGNLAGKFKQESKKHVRIDRNFTLNLGTLTDGKKYPMLFFGATLVSFAPKVPIKSCAADFYDSSTFTVTEAQAKKGKVVVTPATPVGLIAKPDPWSFKTGGTLKVSVEHQDTTLLNAIDVNTVQLFQRLGNSGSIQPTGIEDIGDVDGDGILDRALTFDSLSLLQLFDLGIVGLTNRETLFLIAETTTGAALMGSVTLTTTEPLASL